MLGQVTVAEKIEGQLGSDVASLSRIGGHRQRLRVGKAEERPIWLWLG